MRILTDSSFFSDRQIVRVENKYSARYVFESQLKLRNNDWSDFPAAIFFTEVSHPEGSNWFGIWNNAGRYMISNAISAVEEPFFGALADNGDVIYSRHRNDFRVSEDRTVFIDGGRDHTRYDLSHPLMKLKVSRDKVVVVPTENKRAGFVVPHTEELGWDIADS